MVGKGYDLETWSTPFTGYGEFEGLKLLVRGQGVWNLKEGDLVYVELEVIEMEYDERGTSLELTSILISAILITEFLIR